MKFASLVLLMFFISCDKKPKHNKIAYPLSKNDSVQFIVICDTNPTIFLNTQDGSISIEDEITCDTIYTK